MKTLKYRADIDGLRALAVLSVVIFHIDPSWMPNGFLGVDIFFVLSGFLITSILYKEIIAKSFSYKTFYVRRIRRILPVFFVVVAASLALSYWLFLPDDAISVGKSAIGSILFGANMLFARHSGYFDVSSEEKPLLHIWSLSIEEQFYFIFPTILILLVWFYGRFIKGRFKGEMNLRKFLYFTLGAMLILCLISSFVPVQFLGITLSSYYLPHIRFGELLVGSLLAIHMSEASENGCSAPWRYKLMGILALIVLLLSLIPRNTFISPWFPGLLALIPCSATALLIYCNRESYWVSKFFSLAPVVWIGKLSYSLYLWHWPVLAFIRYFWGVGVLPLWLTGWAIVAMFGLSALSYYLVEQPIRKLPLSFGKSLAAFYLIPAVIIISFVLLKKDFLPIEPQYSGFLDQTNCCFNTLEGDCLMGNLEKEPKVLIAGDSHTAQLSRFWDYMARYEGWSAFVSASISCPFFFEYDNFIEWQGEGVCASRNDFLRQEYKRYPIIILANYWGARDYAANQKVILANLFQTLERLTKERKKVYLVNSSYQVNTPPVREYYAEMKGVALHLNRWDRDPRGSLYEETKRNATVVREFVEKNFPHVTWIDLERYLPKDLKWEGKPMMGDAHHLNAYGAEVLAKIFSQNGRLIEPKDLQ
ncbi:acyltransferase family protein [Porphyromonas sp. COT-290 OH3588]|uniref:acyltransferase family protein n=1 Tax=Porphyromonas sp. COT-290 OH3588 TaxID=1515617 RepID=UPI00052DF2C2|nr:acyltransferase family protein [Porphyromonas sp. COT-290 OH3588]KGO01472.1 hypothetical protein HQ48_01845 [Porphyromonas sp. COT-290 OH3588]